MSPRRLLVTGGSGYLGGEIVRRAARRGLEGGRAPASAVPGRCGSTCATGLRSARSSPTLRPDCVIHTAYLQDGDEAWATNVEGTANVAARRGRLGARLVHLSTDLVFDGRAGPYREDDPPDPVLDYGRSKAAAERAAIAAHPSAVLVRTSLIYGGDELSGHERRILDVVDGRSDLAFFTDELRCPVRVADLADALLALVPTAPAGPLHLAGADGVSRYEFACLVAAANGRRTDHLRTTTSAETAPQRPRDCRLDCSRATALLGAPLPGVRAVLGAARF